LNVKTTKKLVVPEGLHPLIAEAVIAEENEKLGDGKKREVEKDGMGVSLVVPTGEGLTGMSEGVLRALESKKLVVGRTRLALGRRIIRADASLAAVVEAVRAVGEESVTTSSGESVTTDWSEYGTYVLPLQVVIEGCTVTIKLNVGEKLERATIVLNSSDSIDDVEAVVTTSASRFGWKLQFSPEGQLTGSSMFWDAYMQCAQVLLVRSQRVQLNILGDHLFWLASGGGAAASVPKEAQHAPAVHRQVKYNPLEGTIKALSAGPYRDLFGVTTMNRNYCAIETSICNLLHRLSDTICPLANRLGEPGTRVNSVSSFDLVQQRTFVNVRPDFSVFAVRGPLNDLVGLMEAKGLCGCSPHAEKKECVLLKPTILGEVYDQLSVVARTTEASHAICILTCVNHTFIVALDTDGDEDGGGIMDAIFAAGSVEELEKLRAPAVAEEVGVRLVGSDSAVLYTPTKLAKPHSILEAHSSPASELDCVSAGVDAMSMRDSTPSAAPSTPQRQVAVEQSSPPTPAPVNGRAELSEPSLKDGDGGGTSIEGTSSACGEEEEKQVERKVIVSQPFPANAVGANCLASILLTTFVKMIYCPRRSVQLDHGDTFEGTALLVHQKEQATWTRLPPTVLNLNEVPGSGTTTFYCIRFFGVGADGRVALACNRGGRVCALKFFFARTPPTDKALTSAEKERRVWHEVYKGLPALTSRVRTEKLREPFALTETYRDALLMPFLRPVEVERRVGMLDKVKACLGKFVDANCEHGDVAWRNIGTYIDSKGEEQVVVFDMSSVIDVKPHSSDGSARWVEEAMNELRSRAVPPVLNA
jgi:hypothetical protein